MSKHTPEPWRQEEYGGAAMNEAQLETLAAGANCQCGSSYAAITSEWEECCREEGFCNRESIHCRAARCWLCGHSWNEVLSKDERDNPAWIYDGESIWP